MTPQRREVYYNYDQPIYEETATKVFEVCGITACSAREDFRLLDFGCGRGRYLEVFKRHLLPQNLVGVEINPGYVREVKRKGFNCALLGTEDASLPFLDCTFDIVFSSNVIEHIRRNIYLGYLREIHRILKPGGRFAVGMPNYPAKRIYDMKKAFSTPYRRYYLFDDPTHCNKMSVFRLERDLKEFFTEINIKPSYIFFERKLKVLQHPKVRYLVRGLSDKVFGYCIKSHNVRNSYDS